MPTNAGSPEATENRRRDLERLGYVLNFTIAFAVIAFFISGAASRFFAPAHAWPTFLTYTAAVGVAALILVTAFVSGAALGFIFGIPRPVEGSTPSQGANGAPTETTATGPSRGQFLGTNSNLVRVSDWLTTMLVGVGLTQLYHLNDLLVQFRDFLAIHARVFDRSADGAGLLPAIGPLLLIFGAVTGFLFMYIHTRLILTPLFDEAERQLRDQVLEVAATQAIARGVQDPSGPVRARATEVAASSPAPGDAAGLANVALAQIVLGNIAPAAGNLLEAFNLRPGDRTLLDLTAKTLAVSGRLDDAARVAATSHGTFADDLRLMFIALYKPAPAGFDEVLRLAQAHATDPSIAHSAEYWFYLAAAQGQRHHEVVKNAGPADQISDARAKALDAAARAIGLDSSYKGRVALLLSGANGEDDLADFAADREFQAIVR